jgi:uncharacterized protein YkwD
MLYLEGRMPSRLRTPRPERPVALTLATLLAATAAGSASPPAEAGTACTKYGDVRAEKLRNRQARASIRCYVDRERRQRGIAELGNNRRLQRAAQNHTEAMMRKACFAHQCSGEASVESRLRKVDYIHGSLARWAYGENLACGRGSVSTPKSMVKAWMQSPGHRGTLLNPTYRDIGVGFQSGIPGSRKADGGTFTADFGLRVRG